MLCPLVRQFIFCLVLVWWERSGSVEECLRGRGFEPYRRHYIVSLSKNINPNLVLVQPRKTCPFISEILLMGCKESNQTKTYWFDLRRQEYVLAWLKIADRDVKHQHVLALVLSMTTETWHFSLILMFTCSIHCSKYLKEHCIFCHRSQYKCTNTHRVELIIIGKHVCPMISLITYQGWWLLMKMKSSLSRNPHWTLYVKMEFC